VAENKIAMLKIFRKIQFSIDLKKTQVCELSWDTHGNTVRRVVQ